jgi:hypothetical protein
MKQNIVTVALVIEVSNFISLHPFSITSHLYCAGECILILAVGGSYVFCHKMCLLANIAEVSEYLSEQQVDTVSSTV